MRLLLITALQKSMSDNSYMCVTTVTNKKLSLKPAFLCALNQACNCHFIFVPLLHCWTPPPLVDFRYCASLENCLNLALSLKSAWFLYVFGKSLKFAWISKKVLENSVLYFYDLFMKYHCCQWYLYAARNVTMQKRMPVHNFCPINAHNYILNNIFAPGWIAQMTVLGPSSFKMDDLKRWSICHSIFGLANGSVLSPGYIEKDREGVSFSWKSQLFGKCNYYSKVPICNI